MNRAFVEQFLRRMAAAVARQSVSGLTRFQPVDKYGAVDPFGAYAYEWDPQTHDLINQLRSETLPYDQRNHIRAAAAERATVASYMAVGESSCVMEQLILFVDRNAEETVEQTRLRIGKAVREGTLLAILTEKCPDTPQPVKRIEPQKAEDFQI